MSSSSEAISGIAGSMAKRPAPVWLAGLGAGLILVSFVLLFSGSAADPARPFLGWLIGISFWLSVLIGMLFLTMIWWMFDSGWSVIVRRQFEHAFAAFPWLAVIFLPLVVISAFNAGSGQVPWIWMNLEAFVPGGHGTVAEDVLYVHKAPYLNIAFFVARYVAIFTVFCGLAYFLRKWSFDMDRTGDHANVHRSRKLSAVGLFLCAFAATLASVDWFKSLSYHWFSTMYGVWFFAASMRAGLAVGMLAMFYQWSKPDGLKGILKPAHFYLMACLMFAFTVFWAYISFSQYFLIYSANIPEETFWYNIREMNKDGSKNSWWWVSMALIFLYFFVPFLYLLWHKNKFGSKVKFMAVWILVFHLVDLYWNIVPQKLPGYDDHSYIVRQFGIHLADVTMFIGVGAVVIWAYLRSAAKERPIPIRDPRIEESLNCHE
jgi:hypothetical protein